MGFLSDVCSGFSSSFRTSLIGDLGFSQAQPESSGIVYVKNPKPRQSNDVPILAFKECKRWTRKSGIPLYNKAFPLEDQVKKARELAGKNMYPYVCTDYQNNKLIVYQTPWTAMASVSATPVEPYQDYILKSDIPKKPLTPSQKRWKKASNFLGYLSSPFSSVRNWMVKDKSDTNADSKPTWGSRICTGLDLALGVSSWWICPPLFWTSLGSGMSKGFIDNFLC